MVFKKGHKVTKKMRKKISETFKKNYKKENHPFYNKHHTEESKIKMSEAKKGKYIGEKNPAWKGKKVSYAGIHLWIKKRKLKLKLCEKCGKKKKLELSNISGKYRRDINDYKWLCIKCHRNLDFPNGLIGKNFQENKR